jgi:hypothetical protein
VWGLGCGVWGSVCDLRDYVLASYGFGFAALCVWVEGLEVEVLGFVG